MKRVQIRGRRSRGFTLIELLAVVALLSVLMMVAVPSLIDFRRRSEINSVTNSLLVAIHEARNEAMKRGGRAAMMPRESNDWATGWQVFVDRDGSGTWSSGDEVLRVETPPPAARLLVVGSGTAAESGSDGKYLLFDSSGYARTRGGGFAASSLGVRDASIDDPAMTRIVKISRTGRARSCRADQPDCDHTPE